MTIIGVGSPLRFGFVCSEYGPSATNAKIGDFYRGAPSNYVRNNSGDNIAVNNSIAVPTAQANLKLSNFYGQGKGWVYTNSTVRVNNYHCHTEFGADWLGANGKDWPCDYINNNGIYSTSTSYYALVFYGRQDNGPCSFTNNSEIQGAGGAPNSGAGQHAVYVYNSENARYEYRPIIYNTYAIRGGGGAGGIGGTGGTGGQGYYDYGVDSGYAYAKQSYDMYYNDQPGTNRTFTYWAGGSQGSVAGNVTSMAIGQYTYYRNALRLTESFDYYGGQGHVYQYTYHIYHYECRQYYVARAYTNGGGGGGGGNGGRGIGYNSPNQGGNGGAPGAGGDTNAGSGGYGGTGGTGGSWGANGNTGNTGATGNSGNWAGGSGGAAGAGGGAAGYCVYAATKWGFSNTNTLNGPYGGGVGNS